MGFSRQEYQGGLPLPSGVTLLQSLIIYRTIHLINCFKSSHHFRWRLSHILGNTRIIVLWNKQNTNGIVNNISGIKSKYFSHEPPTPVFFLKIVKTREWVTQSRSLIFHVAQMCYIKRFIRYKNTAFSLNYSTDTSLRCCKVSRVLQLYSTAFLIKEILEFNRLIAQLLSFKAYESC